MKLRYLLIGLLTLGSLGTQPLRAQFGSFGDVPIEITAEGETRFIGGVAVAENNVVIHYGPTSLYADYAQYNPDTRDVLVIGNVRVYRDGRLFAGDRALYNLETKLLRTGELVGSAYPFFFHGKSVSSLQGKALMIHSGEVTTSDSSKPDYHLKAKTVRIYPGDYVVLSNVQLFVGTTPVFWFPYIYQSLKRNEGFNFTPGYSSDWGAYLLTQYGFPINENLHGMVHLDFRSTRGVGLGLDVAGKYGEDNRSWVRFKSYYSHDSDSSHNPSAQKQEEISAERYRVTFQDRAFFTEDIYATANINKLSDRKFLRDFYPSDYHEDPQPDNVVSLTKKSDNYTITAIARAHFNEFFDDTQRLPELVLDFKRHPIFGSGVFYEGETGIARLQRDFGEVDNTKTTPFASYQATRFDSFHQFVAPQILGGWLSVIPRIGFRSTYYSSGARSLLDDYIPELNAENFDLNQDARTLYQEASGSPLFRATFNAGIESSFKFSREWENVQSRKWGLDGLRHIVQPYTNLSYVYTNKDPDEILQFDRLNPSTQLPPLDFPQFTTLDTISKWSIWRLGVRNRLQTRRDDRTLNWLEMDTYFDINLDSPDFPGAMGADSTFSNLYNRVAWTPLPWLNFSVDSQFPLFNHSFIEINPAVTFMVTRDLRLTVAHRYLDNNPYFTNSSNLRFLGYYRINDNWGLSVREQYEFQTKVLETQEYSIQRDLSSWVASLGFQVRDNINTTSGKKVTDYSVLLTFTLKDLPALSLPVSFNPSSSLSE